ASTFARAGCEVMLVTFRPGGPLDGGMTSAVRRVSLQKRDWNLDWFAPRLVETLSEFGPGAVQLMGRMANAHGGRIIRALPDASVVATFRTGRDIPWLYARTLRRARAVVANSDHAARAVISRHGAGPARVHVIRNGVAGPPRITDPDTRRSVRARIGTPAQAVVLLCCAMMRPGKGHRDLVEIASRLDPSLPWELWIAGEGVERAACEALTHAQGLSDRVRFLGARADTTQLYAAADIAVLSSHTESLPNFLVEAQWSGLPVVAWDVAGVRETFLPSESGLLVAEHDRGQFAAAVHALAADARARARMSEAAVAHARREFDPQRQNARYLELYARVRA
ncbi:MAG: glycosyltransferase family 4 protein, partial [Opitutaceae bacterium]